MLPSKRTLVEEKVDCREYFKTLGIVTANERKGIQAIKGIKKGARLLHIHIIL